MSSALAHLLTGPPSSLLLYLVEKNKNKKKTIASRLKELKQQRKLSGISQPGDSEDSDESGESDIDIEEREELNVEDLKRCQVEIYKELARVRLDVFASVD